MSETTKKDQSPAYRETVEEIMKTYRSLPPRPPIDEILAANSVIQAVNTEEKQRLDEISSQECPQDVPSELFSVLQQVRKTMVLFQSHQHRKEAIQLVEFDNIYNTFDDLILTASKLVSGGGDENPNLDCNNPASRTGEGVLITDETLVSKRGNGGDEQLNSGSEFKGLVESSSSILTSFSSDGGKEEKMSLMKVTALIERTAKKGDMVLDLQAKLMDNVEWLPHSLGKLTSITELNLSDNKIMALPSTISSLTGLTRLDIHANQLINLPDSFGELVSLTDLDLHANRLKSLPDSFGKLTRLVTLDLSSNHYIHLPDIMGNLASLRILNVEANELEELPFTIGSCSSLVEMRLDFNQLKALPEAMGKLECLEILTLRYNRIRKLPTTMSNMTCLRELNVSFNELESIPETLCSAVSLEKLNVGNNFTDLQELPRSIGSLENLQELDISYDQIRVLPDSFGLLSKLIVFRADETPLEVPPREITKSGAQAVVQYMADLGAKGYVDHHEPKRNKGFWCWSCCLFSN